MTENREPYHLSGKPLPTTRITPTNYAETAVLFTGAINAPAQTTSSFGSFTPAAFGFTMPSATGPVAATPHAAASAQGIINQTNAQRVANGLAPLRVDLCLTNLAQDWANALSRDGKTRHRPNYWTDYPAGGENVLQAWSDYSDARLVQLWMDSPGHRKDLLDPRAKSVGIGMAVAADGKLDAVQNFGW